MKIFLFLFLIPFTAYAQVNVCIDGKGRKTFTEADCAELGLSQGSVIKDIKPKPKRCYDLEAQIEYQRKHAAKLRTTNAALNIGEAMATIHDGEVTRLEQQYNKECKR